MANKLAKLYEKQHKPLDTKSAMATLLSKKVATQAGFKKGELVQGTITKLTRGEVLVNISGKAEAVVLEKDRQLLNNILAALKVGDTVTISILNPESEINQKELTDQVVNDIKKIPQFKALGNPVDSAIIKIDFAYPLQMNGLDKCVNEIHTWYKKFQIFHCGRGGSFDYCNADQAFLQGKTVAQEIYQAISQTNNGARTS